MNKSDLIKYVSDTTMITERDAGVIINVFLKGIQEGLESNEKITIKNFGSFSLQERKERDGVNPKTQEPIKISAKKRIKFKVAKKLYNTINK